ncbi:hypothetical protein [Synoicihabitans lomoniglobus]|uniref:Chromosome partition protein Smc n=1 Tax=Synoicihabitans lomoniglobus TaxID=2909285 RepID=A0AAF0CRC5_9BACT|nr:hypothetical protein [Opitutaceae bacterium LMO-M01]WED66641.1 hypothetical protein PXH66_07230 [Opitutaceae bacterium LMO-M01]
MKSHPTRPITGPPSRLVTYLAAAIITIAAFANAPAARAETQTLTVLGANGTAGAIDTYSEASRDQVTWGPAYLFTGHPWGNVQGTNAWLNFDPDPAAGVGTNDDHAFTYYRIRFVAPASWVGDPSIAIQMIADNRGHATLNNTFLGTIDGSGSFAPSGAALVPGVNYLYVTLEDWGGINGINYRIDISVDSDDGFILAEVTDTDIDGLNSDEEAALGTDPDNPDTDGDGVLDGVDEHPLDASPELLAQIAELEQLLADCDDYVALLEQQLQACNANSVGLASDLDVARTQISVLTSERDDCLAMKADLEAQLAAALTANSVLQDALNAANATISTQAGDLASAYATITTLSAELASSGATIASLTADLDAANAEIDALNADLVIANDQIDTLTTELDDATAQIATLTANLSAANATIAGLTTDLAHANNTIAGLVADLEAANGQINILTADLVSANAQIDGLTSDLATANGQIDTLTSELDDANAQITTLTADLGSANAQIAALTLDLAAAQATIADLQAIIAAQTTLLGFIDTDISAYEQYLRDTFRDPTFQIAGDNSAEKVSALIASLFEINRGDTLAIYRELGGDVGYNDHHGKFDKGKSDKSSKGKSDKSSKGSKSKSGRGRH